MAYLLPRSSLQLISEAPPNLDPRVVVPLCTIELRPGLSPTTLPATVEALLDQTEQTPQLEQACLQATHQLLAKQPQVDQQWQQLMATLPPKVELDLLSRLIAQCQPTRNHWRSLFELVDYDLGTSWHYRGTLLIAAVLSIIAVASLGTKAHTHPEDALIVGSFGFATTVILVFWLALRQGIETSLEPTLFSELGFFGGATFVRQVNQALSKHIIWPGTKSIYKVFIFMAVYAAVAVYTTGAFAVYTAGAFAVFVPVFVAVFVASVSAVVVSGAVVRIVSFTGAVAFSVVVSGAVAFSFLVSGAVTFSVVVSSAVSGAAIGAWSQLKPNPERGYLKFLAVLAFPWFCWLPIVSILSSWALYDFLSQVSPISHFPVWLQTALGVVIVAGVWAALWHRGQWLDAGVRNPFHGGALGAALGVKRSELKKTSST